MPSAPWPLIEISVAAVSDDNRSSLRSALLELVAETPGLDFSTDSTTGQFIFKAGTEQCLGAALECLRAGPIAFETGQLQVAYRERLTRRREIDFLHKRLIKGNEGQFARVKLRFEPSEPGVGNVFNATITEGILPSEYVDGIERGVASVLSAGVVAGCPVIEVTAELIDGAYHEIDSSPLAFEIAARAAFREALHGSAVLAEPIMAVEIAVPERSAAWVISDLQGRRGLIRDRSVRSDATIINATVPLAEMLGFGSRLQSVAGDEARFSMAFSHYAPVPSLDLDPPPMVAALRA
ncbi:elongation factor G [Methylobacterium sp. RAS18]|nr:elongation factor G [Methylobacterium sp. RAS18]